MEASSASLERNLRLIPLLEILGGSMVYLPIFVLFTRANFGIGGALQIASLTYLFIVALEVPSGWMSDRFGRVITLRLAVTSLIVGQLCFLFGGEQFAVIVIGQLFVSAYYAFVSGTDVSFHYDTLEAVGKSDEYRDRQARVSSYGYLMRAASAVVGGLLGLIDLRLPFAAALVLALIQLGVTARLTEPQSASNVRADAFVAQVRHCLGYLRNRFVAWLFAYGIALVTLEHVAFTLMQPWLTEVLGRSPDELGATPLVSGILLGSVAFVGAGAAGWSSAVAARFGTVATLIALGALSASIVTGMALTISVLALGLVLFRSVQGAAAPVLISAAVAPRTEPRHRATLLSLNSLAGRLGYGAFLQLLATNAVDDPAPVLRVMAVVSWVLVGLLLASGAWATRQENAPIR